MIGEISEANREQASGVEEISTAVNHMDEMTQKNASLAVESASSAKALSEQAAKLEELVRFFRIDGSAASRPAAPKTQAIELRADRAWSAAERPAPKKAATDGSWAEF